LAASVAMFIVSLVGTVGMGLLLGFRFMGMVLFTGVVVAAALAVWGVIAGIMTLVNRRAEVREQLEVPVQVFALIGNLLLAALWILMLGPTISRAIASGFR